MPRIRRRFSRRYPQLFAHWPRIVGPGWAKICRPIMDLPYPAPGGTLVVESPPGKSQVVAMQKEIIINMINDSYGCVIIGDLRVHRPSQLEFTRRNWPVNPTSRGRSLAWEIVKDIEHPVLRSALYDLGEIVCSRRSDQFVPW